MTLFCALTTVTALAYGSGPARVGDLHLPEKVTDVTPVVLSIHGGGWSAMCRHDVRGIADFLAENGCAVYNIDYRLATPQTPWPACGDDCLAAARFILDGGLGKFGLRPKRIWTIGGSAGGHLALWTGLNLPADKVSGIVSISGIADPGPDLERNPARYRTLFGGRDPSAADIDSMSMMRLVGKDGPRILLTHAEEDTVVPLASALNFHVRYREAGPIRLYRYSSSAEPNTGGHCIWRKGVSNPRRLLGCIEREIGLFMGLPPVRVSDAAYGNYDGVPDLCAVPFDEDRGGAGTPPLAVGAGEIRIAPPRIADGAPAVKATDYGLSEAETDNGAAIERALVAARKTGAHRLVLAPGVYRCFGQKGILIEGFEDFVFDGAGAELVFRRDAITDPMVPSWNHDPSRANFVIRNCRRMTIGGFDMDWDWKTAPLATGARITAVHVDEKTDNASYCDFELLGHGERHPYFGRLFPVQYLVPMSADFRHFGERNHNWWMGTYEGDAGAKAEWLDPTHVRVYPSVFDPKTPHWGGPNGVGGNPSANRKCVRERKVGETVRLSHHYYGKGGFTLDSNEDFALHDVRVYACFGFGVYIDGAQRNWTLRNVAFKPRDLRHPISCSADTVHFSHSQGGAIIDGLRTSHGEDDVINVHDRFTVAKRTGPRSLKTILRRGAVYFMPRTGATVELRAPTLHPLGWRGTAVSVSADGEIAFDRDLPAEDPPEGFFLVFDRSFSCDRVIVRNCTIEDNEQRCLFNASDVTVENCVFRRTSGDAVRLLADYTLTYWCEGTGVTNLVIRNSTFENNCTGRQTDCPWNMGADLTTCLGLPPAVKLADADKSFVSRILVEDCTFRDSLSYFTVLRFGRDIVFRNNRIETTARREDRLPTSGFARLGTVENVLFENNVFRIPQGAEPPRLHLEKAAKDVMLRGNRTEIISR